MRTVLKWLGLIFLIWLSMNLWNIFSPLFLPGPAVGPGEFASVQQELQGRAKARLAGPEALQAYHEELERKRPFDNSLVINYTMPLLLVWLACAVNRARKISPLAFAAAQLLLDLVVYVVVEGAGLAAPYVRELSPFIGEALHDLSSVSKVKLIMLLLVVALCLAWRACGLVSFVFSSSRRVDRALRSLFDNESGWFIRNHGEETARRAQRVMLVLLNGLAAWLLWQACDAFDGRGIPDLFGYLARSAAVAFGAFMMVRPTLSSSTAPRVPPPFRNRPNRSGASSAGGAPSAGNRP